MRPHTRRSQPLGFAAHTQSKRPPFVLLPPINAVKGSHPLRVEGGAIVATAAAKLPAPIKFRAVKAVKRSVDPT